MKQKSMTCNQTWNSYDYYTRHANLSNRNLFSRFNTNNTFLCQRGLNFINSTFKDTTKSRYHP